ncbi:hypothetical protein VB775_07270 [Pseudanabaena sp. CCNP1317]|nr:hypothetical protein [Pseudanabaena sp. CCNP1317]
MRHRGIRSVLPLAVCAVAASSSWSVGGVSLGDAAFVFDGEFRSRGGLTFSFSRATEAKDPEGNSVGVDEPRFGRPRLLAPTPIPETVRQTSNRTLLLGSGLDHDGVTPLLIVSEGNRRYLDVFWVADDALLEAETTGEGRVRTVMVRPGGGSVIDLMRGAVEGRAFSPKAGTICHGLLVLMCEVSHETEVDGATVWLPGSVALVISADRGETWQVVYEEPVDQLGNDRVREWSLQNWWPLVRGEAPTEAWFAGADYRHQAGAGGEPPLGGAVYVFRATRAQVGAPWVVEPVVRPIIITDGPNSHVHAAGVMPFGNGGIRVFAGIGDSLTYQRIVSATLEDASSYDTAQDWDYKDDYHGSFGTRGLQFVGCAPGPDPYKAILGSDENGDQIVMLQADDNAGSRADLRHLYGFGLTNATGSRNFVIRTPTPELGGPYVSNFEPGNSTLAASAKRLQFSPDGERWAEAWCPATAAMPSAAVHGNHIYVDSRVNSTGIRRIPVPETLEIRPLLLSSGVENKATASMSAPLPTDSSNELTLLDQASAEALDPPTDGPVYRIGSLANGSSNLARFRPVAQGTQHAFGAVVLRFWLRVEGAEGAQVIIRRNTPGFPAGPWFRYPLQQSANVWAPFVLRDTPFPGEWETMEYQVHSSSPSDPFVCYLAVDTLTADGPLTGMSVPPEQTYASEFASVGSFPALGDEWSVTLSGHALEYLWDSVSTGGYEYPLARIVSDELNYIELIARPSSQDVLVRPVVNGQAPGFGAILPGTWLRGTQLRVCISRKTDGQLEFTSSIGHRLMTQGVILGEAPLPPVRIDFWGGTQSQPGAFAWHGGRVDARAFTQQERSAVLATLLWLDIPSVDCPGDTNGDGVVNFADLNNVLSTFGQSGAPGFTGADLNDDGVVNFADLNIVLSNFGVDCG